MALQMLHVGKVDSMQDAVNSEVLFGDPASTGVMSQDGCDLRGQADSALPEALDLITASHYNCRGAHRKLIPKLL